MNINEKYVNIFLRLILYVSFLFLFPGCATKIMVSMLQPALYHEASLTKAVAVLPFSGAEGRQFAMEVEGVLAGIAIEDKRYFTLVDRTALDKTISEMQLAQSGMVDQKTAAKLGKLVGAEGIYTGVVLHNGCVDSRYQEKRTTCTQYEAKRDRDGNIYQGPCINWRQYHVSCTKRVASFTVAPKLVEVATGKILYSRNLSATAESTGCTDTKPLQVAGVLIEKAKEAVKKDFRLDIAPHYVTTAIKLMDSADGIDSPEARGKLENGIAYADKGRLESACELWGEALNISRNSPALLYNLGVCAESRGDLDNALNFYKQADRILGKPDDDITLALNRVSTAIRKQDKLKQELGEK